MISGKSKIQKHIVPFSWVELENIFDENDRKELSETYPTDNYRTISINADTRQYSYDVRGFIGLDRKINKEEFLSTSWKRLANYLLSQEYRNFVSNLSGVDVHKLNFEANIYKYSKDCFMDAHCDLDIKTLTNVLYFNSEWNSEDGGYLRILNSKNEDDIYARISPVIGNSILFIRSDNSWHSVEKTICDKSRRSVTVTFYKEGSTSPMWKGEKYEFHDNHQ